jgi:hypothetical protein
MAATGHSRRPYQHAITGGLHNPATMFLHLRIAQFAPDRAQCGERPFLAAPISRE